MLQLGRMAFAMAWTKEPVAALQADTARNINNAATTRRDMGGALTLGPHCSVLQGNADAAGPRRSWRATLKERCCLGGGLKDRVSYQDDLGGYLRWGARTAPGRRAGGARSELAMDIMLPVSGLGVV